MVKPSFGEYFSLTAFGVTLAFLCLPRVYAIGVCIATLITFILYVKWCYGFFKRMGLQGPTPVPPFGNFADFFTGGGIHAASMRDGPKYGKVYGTYQGLTPVFNVWDLDVTKNVMVKDFGYFTNRIDAITEHDISKEKDVALFDNVLTVLNDQKWRDVRNTVTPAFTTGKLKHMIPYINESAVTFMDILKNDSNGGQTTMEIKKYMSGFTMDVIASVALGVKVDSLRNPDDPIVKNAAAVNMFSFKNLSILFFFIFPWLSRKLRKWFGLQLFRIEADDFFKQLLRRVIDSRRQNPKTKDPDFLQLMMNAAKETPQGQTSESVKAVDDDANACPYEPHVPAVMQQSKSEITDDIIMSQAFIFLVAGFDTTAITLELVSYSLAVHPDIQQKCYQEVIDKVGKEGAVSYERIQHLDYLECVILETLRMYPALPAIGRVASKDYNLSDSVVVPKGCTVNIMAYLIHHSPEYYPEPEEFRPERFDDEERQNRHPCAFQPFGFGPRNCIGMRFALTELKVVLCHLLRNFRFIPSETTEVPLKVYSTNLLRPVNPVKLKLMPRTTE